MRNIHSVGICHRIRVQSREGRVDHQQRGVSATAVLWGNAKVRKTEEKWWHHYNTSVSVTKDNIILTRIIFTYLLISKGYTDKGYTYILIRIIFTYK